MIQKYHPPPPALEDIYKTPTDGIFTNSSYDDEGAVADFTNLETIMNVSPIPTSRINSFHPSTLILEDPKLVVQTRSKVTKSSEAHAFISYGKRAIEQNGFYRNKEDERGLMSENKERNPAQEVVNSLAWGVRQTLFLAKQKADHCGYLLLQRPENFAASKELMGMAEFHETIDFLTRSSIHHALTVSLVVSTTLVEQFWTSAKSKIINNVRHITAKLMGIEGITVVNFLTKLCFHPNGGPFILNEVLQWCKSKKKQSLIFKVDFEKAYDSVRWDFLDEVLKKFGFGDKWCTWIQSCLRSSRGSIIINGSPTAEFQFHKGLKQGDPLSPFLFILIMESLHLSFQRVVDARMFKGITLSSSLMLSHMFYADDVIFVGQWCDDNINTLVQVLECFFHASGLHINMNKSKLMGVLVDDEKVKQAASKLGCLILKPPFSYLGSKVGGSMHRIQAWNEVVDRVYARLSKWKMKTLSIGGRLTLLKSVLGSMPIYHMSIFRVPMSVLRRLESIRSHFFNGHDPNSKRTSWVKWKNVLASKEKGGLGVSSLYALNRGLMFKWVWRFFTQNTSLWSRVIKAIHGEDGKVGKQVKSAFPSYWMDIVHEINVLKNQGINLLNCMQMKLGNGDKTAFWEDIWIGHIVLKDLYPRIYALETCKFVKVGTKLTQSSLDFSFRRKPRGGIEQEQYEALLVQVQDVNLVPVSDRWKWSLENSGDFSVASVRKMLDDKMLPDVTTKTRWIKLVPIKVNVHAWKVKIDSLPTRFNISRRGMDIESITCSICDNEVESSSHLFFKCNMVRDIIRKITRWWDITYIEADSYEDWLNWLVNLRLSFNYKQALEGVFYVMW
ncbi:RNA-directed DNA polymerase, eukaryota, reverse transcriptase zinc-binding domain protein [Tanacetum coccineum]